MHDTEFMSAKQKERVLNDWTQFILSRFDGDHFTLHLYKHLTLHCSFTAHYDRGGFYYDYFVNAQKTIKFMSQFDRRHGGGFSIEVGSTRWLTDERYTDINTAMCRVMEQHADSIYDVLTNAQRDQDLALAAKLLRKHGIEPPNEII